MMKDRMKKKAGKRRRDALHGLLEVALRVQEETVHHVHIDFSNYGYEVYVHIMLGGFHESKKYDFYRGFNRSDMEAIRQTGGYVRSLLKAETPAGGAAGGSG